MRLDERAARVQELERFYPALDEAVDEFSSLADEASLSEEELVEDAEAEADAILAPLSQAWRDFVEAREAEQMLRLIRMDGERLRAYWARWMIATLPWALGLTIAFVVAFRLISPFGTIPTLWTIGLVAVSNVFLIWGTRRIGGGVARERREAAELGYGESLRRAIQAWLRQRINAARQKSYATKLDYRGDHRGLAEVDDASHEVPTGAKERLVKMMEWMPGGAIGISGPRGVGKSTLMRSVCTPGDSDSETDSDSDSGPLQQDKPILATVVDAPVDYDGRDFVLHLFAKVCALVVGEDEVAKLRGRRGIWPALKRPGGGLFALPLMPSGAIALLVGLVLYDAGTPSFDSSTLGIVAIAAGLALLSYGALAELTRRARRVVDGPKSAGDSANIRTATELLQRIWFQQSFSSGWAGTLKVPAGAEGRLESGAEMVEQPMTFPDVVEEFKQFLRQVSRSRRIRIGIDELDKMTDEDARRFLNEIKVVFRVPGCFFLISISEDAMSFFERRGLPIRDVFDSSLDDVTHIPQMRFAGSEALIDRRIVDLPLPFACLLHCISGGLPRDLIRAARDLVERGKGTALDQATVRLVGDALTAKAGASKVAARRFKSEAHVTLLNGWLEGLLAAGGDPGSLLGICRDFEADFLDPIAALPEEEDLRAERRELQSLGTQMLAFSYLAATMLEFFPRFAQASYVDRALEAGTEEGALSRVDRLAEVTQTFSADVNTAWEMLSRLRDDLDFERVEFPRPRPVRDVAPQPAAAAGVPVP
jgi:KAP-like P-loop domain-containing protein